MEALSDCSDTDKNSDELLVLPENFEPEVDINIHFHCEHCFKLNKCNVRPKVGWSCDIVQCRHGCSMRFHECKRDEHELICTHVKAPCINAGNGCPLVMQRRFVSRHLQSCPASVIVCNAEWNRWALGARDREKVVPPLGFTAQYNSEDIDMAVALEDQNMVHELQDQFMQLKLVSSGIAPRKCSNLPISMHGTIKQPITSKRSKQRSSSQNGTEEDEETLTPGLSLSVCTSLLREKKSSVGLREDLLPTSGSVQSHDKIGNCEDFSARCCTHGIMKDICNFCKYDPEEPNYKIAYVWRENISFDQPGEIVWDKVPRVEKLRKRGPFGTFFYKRVEDSDEEEEKAIIVQHCLEKDKTHSNLLHKRFSGPNSVQSEKLGLELVLKDYSRHQTKSKAMFTFQCLQELRRDQYEGHYQNVHCEIREGLDGWVVERCPMHIVGCPFITQRLFPGWQDGKLVYSSHLKSFSIKEYEISSDRNVENINRTVLDCSQIKLLDLPVEILQEIALYLDGYTLNNFSLTCNLLRSVCEGLLESRGLVIQEWKQCINNDKVSWQLGNHRWFFPKSFNRVQRWRFQNFGDISNHLSVCSYNIRVRANNKFCYTPGIADEVRQHRNKISKT